MEEIFNVSWPWIHLEKSKTIKGLSVKILELWDLIFREGEQFLDLYLQEGRVEIL